MKVFGVFSKETKRYFAYHIVINSKDDPEDNERDKTITGTIYLDKEKFDKAKTVEVFVESKKKKKGGEKK